MYIDRHRKFDYISEIGNWNWDLTKLIFAEKRICIVVVVRP